MDARRSANHRVLGPGEAAGVPFGTGGQRLHKLDAILAELRALLATETDTPSPPIMLSGRG
ncbi:hypothetical protein [Kibdelosporangium aridum]|uniref:Uncharacterized protein n=1 Tax=Kibdelosporangium aridum TaxID=2030 RepID=A0A1W2BGC8_KIBAR|nr:hypothetical protein [Kibdelosporangium aridum]SMC71498.1 hypothetical protein SAMN05661093_01646 [Kibdelosporangium aridum]